MPRKKKTTNDTLPVVPLRGMTVFPHMVLNFDVGRAMSVAAVEKAMLNPAASGAEILMIAGMEDECWDADGSVQKLLQTLKAQHYPKHVRVLRFRHGSHLSGLMPNRTREKRLYRLAPLIGLFYRTFGRYRKENMAYFARAEREIIDWIRR